MKLYLMRHGPAEDHAGSGLDADRALTPNGRRRVADVARCLAEAGESPLHIVSSPLVRAVQTAEIVAAVTGLRERLSIRPELGLGVGGLAVVDELRREPVMRTMLIGHEPDMSSLVALLVGTPLSLPFGKGMVVGVALEAEGAKLRFLLDPQELRIAHA